MSVENIIDELIEREGREYTDRPADKGGPTKFGITLLKLQDFRSKPCTAEDVMNLTEAEARAIYRLDFVTRPGFLKINNETVRAFMVDAAVQHGATAAIKMLQTAACVVADGKFGDATEYAVNRMAPRQLFASLYILRQNFYGELIAHDPELRQAVANGYVHLQAQNALGWSRRLASQLREGLAL
jgi:lysozyme family protein